MGYPLCRIEDRDIRGWVWLGCVHGDMYVYEEGEILGFYSRICLYSVKYCPGESGNVALSLLRMLCSISLLFPVSV